MEQGNQDGIVVARLGCMDWRHGDGEYRKGLQKALGQRIKLYEMRLAGGAGIIASLGSEHKKFVVDESTKIGVDAAHCKLIVLDIHGTSAADSGPCAGYATAQGSAGFTPMDPKESREHAIRELNTAAAYVRSQFPGVQVRTFFVTFGPAKPGFGDAPENIFEEIESSN